MRVIVSRQRENWNLPHVNSLLNVWGIPFWRHTFSQKLGTEFCGAKIVANQQCFSKYTFVKTKENALQLKLYSFSPMFLFEQQEEEWWKETDTYTASTRFWMRDATYQNLETSQNWKCLIESWISRHLMLKTYLRWSHKLPNPKLTFKNCRIKA